VSLRDFFALPALIMFILGVLLAGTVVNTLHSAKAKVTS
jgi:archaellum component FlaG (FlaF/FlaG flagellin family)